MEYARKSIQSGTYRASYIANGGVPSIEVYRGSTKLMDAVVSHSGSEHCFDIEFTIPEALLDQTPSILVIKDAASETVLDAVSISVGGGDTENLSERVAHLEAELDLLKAVLQKTLKR